MRAEIASWPDGSHTFVDYMDSDGVGGPPVRLQVEITVAGDELRADFTGTDPQVSGAINNTLSFTSSVVALCVRSVLREDIPNTAGMFRPLEIVAPPGTVVNGVMPAGFIHARHHRLPPGRYDLRGRWPDCCPIGSWPPAKGAIPS